MLTQFSNLSSALGVARMCLPFFGVLFCMFAAFFGKSLGAARNTRE
jgi:hypothetical protein